MIPEKATRFDGARLGILLTATHGIVGLQAMVTGPLLAHALGAVGRGKLAAVLVPFGLVPALIDLGTTRSVTWLVARGIPVRRVATAAFITSLVIGVMFAIAGWPLAALLGHGHADVTKLLRAGFITTPLLLLGTSLQNINWGLRQWTPYIAGRLLTPLFTLAGLVVLTSLHHATVVNVVILTISASLLSAPISLISLRRYLRFQYQRDVLRATVIEGAKSWIGTLASVANVRLDQLLLIPFVSPSQLAYYVVASSIATLPPLAAGVIATLCVPIAARRDGWLIVLRGIRILVLLGVSLSVGLAALSPIAVPFAFGADFRATVPLAWILLVGTIPLSFAFLLNQTTASAGAPEIGTYGELAALVVTAVGLTLTLPRWGIYGAAATSTVAYTANAIVQLAVARRRFPGTVRDYLLPGLSDVQWLWTTLAPRFLRHAAPESAG